MTEKHYQRTLAVLRKDNKATAVWSGNARMPSRPLELPIIPVSRDHLRAPYNVIMIFINFV